MTKPILFLDIDGVLNPYHNTDHHTNVDDEDGVFRISFTQSAWIKRLMKSYEVVWATWWLDEANSDYGPALDLPPLKVVKFPMSEAYAESPKINGIKKFAGDRPFVWLDDEITDFDRAWADEREIPTLIVQPDFRVGATVDDFESIEKFAQELLVVA